MAFYASLNLTQQNSLWPHFNEFNQFITRTQSILQTGKPDNELLVYWPVYDVWSAPKGKMEMITVHTVDEWLHPTEFYKQSKNLMDSGYSLDFISDDMISKSRVEQGRIQTSEKNQAQVLIIPSTEFMPIETLKNILKLAEQGAHVIFQSKPKSTPGYPIDQAAMQAELDQLWETLNFENGKSEHGNGQVILSNSIQSALEELEIERETLVDSGLDFIRRKTEDGTYYFLVNHSPHEIHQTFSLNVTAEQLVAMDPLTGSRGILESNILGSKTNMSIFLKSGESIFIKALEESIETALPSWPDYSKAERKQDLSTNWSLTFKEGQPHLPSSQQMETIHPWTNQGDPSADDFSGQANYTSNFDLEKNEGKRYVLQVDQVYESAKVWINGEYAGAIWSIPFQLDVTEHLKNGQNSIKIEVASLMANSIRYLDRNGIQWRNYHEINFVNIDYQPFDASNWNTMPSGIGGKVQLLEF
ncbi:glycosyl hydrolase [Algoriphagus halophilus]|uniref:glycosylhydrolase-like jelly roll fold domain-containing protein n=1 Tax=Algoriphagus halophilus TaxID=226505 RepID=UPI00358DF061